MKSLRSGSLSACLLTLFCAVSPAFAQFGSTSVALLSPGDRAPRIPPTDPMAKPENGAIHTFYAQVFPFADFSAGGGGSARGFLASAEGGYAPRGSKSSFAFGGWYWRDYSRSTDIFEVHGKYYWNAQWGIQGGYLNASTGGRAFDAFLLYNLTPRKPDAYRWSAQIGFGPFWDITDYTTTDITAFVQLSSKLSRNLSLDLTYWFVRDRADSVSRLAIGFGWQF